MDSRALLLPLMLLAAPALADAPLPSADLPSARDSELLKRYEGAYIISYQHSEFDALRIPLSALKPTDTTGETDAHNNRLHRPERSVTAEGKVTRLVYLIPEKRSPLEALRNYQQELEALGGSVEFECQDAECGGDPHRATSGGGGKMSLAQYFLYEDSVKDAAFSNGACALTSRIDEQRFLTARVPQELADSWVTVHTYRLTPGTYCKPLSGRVVALVHVVQPKPREQKMVQVSADEMAGALTADGSIALYGIYFDTDQAQIKPDSAATLQEIAALLQQHPNLNLLVVGHTDNQGAYAHNLSLSDRRAQAVKAALEQQFGIDPTRLTAAGAGMLAPVASNDTEAGRAKNRRVALVKLQ